MGQEFLFIHLLIYLFIYFGKERDQERGGVEGEGENQKQVPLPAQNLAWGLISRPYYRDLSPNQESET